VGTSGGARPDAPYDGKGIGPGGRKREALRLVRAGDGGATERLRECQRATRPPVVASRLAVGPTRPVSSLVREVSGLPLEVLGQDDSDLPVAESAVQVTSSFVRHVGI
jgi:hypothetical protein